MEHFYHPQASRRPVLASGTVAVAIAVFAICAAAQSTATVPISGGITTDKSAKADGAVVRFHPVGAATARVQGAMADSKVAIPAPVSTITDKQSAFSLEGIAPGEYVVCIESLKNEVLNPCEWNLATAKVTVTSDEKQKPLSIPVSIGTTLRIRVEDADHLIPTPFQVTKGTVFQIGVFSKDGNLHPARYVSSDAKGHNFELIIPLDTDLRLLVEAGGMVISDAKGNKLDLRAPAIIRVDRGKAAVRLNFTAAAGAAEKN